MKTMKNNILNYSLGFLFIIISCITPIMSYILYCKLLITYNCSQEGLSMSIIFSCILFVFASLLSGMYLITEKPL